MEVASSPAAPEPGEIWALKQCLLRCNNSREQHGMAASCLEELRNKASDILAIDKSQAPVTLVLEEDGTIVDDYDYFLCLPANTKFVALAGNEKWTHNSDGGTAWITQESFHRDETDSGAGLKWKNVARQLKEDLSSIILMSKEELQMLTDVPCSELPQELGQNHVVVQGLQNTLQQVLDQKEEARQSRQLVELYLQALEKEGSILLKQQESRRSSDIMPASQILLVLKEKSAPELSLSGPDLEHAYAVQCLVTQSCLTLQLHGPQPTRLLSLWGFSRQEYWSGLPCPPPGDIPNPGIEPRPPTLQDSLSSEPPGKLLACL
uniref:CIDE-N domain-containing protein n=1 Tax=Bos mutus grunniens TaxID=30521 RepID=A0A8B9W367_BOSMU